MAGLDMYTKPELVAKVESMNGIVNHIVVLPNSTTFIVALDSRTIAVYQKRQEGMYWSSATDVLPASVESMLYLKDTRRLFCGQKNGTLSLHQLSPDCNSLQYEYDVLPHTKPIIALAYMSQEDRILSVERDSRIVCIDYSNKQMYSYESGARISAFLYDDSRHWAFIADVNGRINQVHVSLQEQNLKVTTISILRSIDACVECLAWDPELQQLFSSNASNSGIHVWSLSTGGGDPRSSSTNGGDDGQPTEGSLARNVSFGGGDTVPHNLVLTGHSQKLVKLFWLPSVMIKTAADLTSVKGAPSDDARRDTPLHRGLLLSIDSSGQSVFWSTDPSRKLPPVWLNSDQCLLCLKPFIWNFKKIFKDKTVGNRQHHCRFCGKAVCAACSPHTSILPRFGFESEVRICLQCKPKLNDYDCHSLAFRTSFASPVAGAFVGPETGRVFIVRDKNKLHVHALPKAIESAEG